MTEADSQDWCCWVVEQIFIKGHLGKLLRLIDMDFTAGEHHSGVIRQLGLILQLLVTEVEVTRDHLYLTSKTSRACVPLFTTSNTPQ
ncbi:MAG: hypothetical protein QNL12_04650 [Acidimicrobiia bacterium]|nr:hypothetical protein [Acidimicrobiia bacterium]MDX2466581.1 hypothetical protein [Acidimicrobiia bacterium]